MIAISAVLPWVIQRLIRPSIPKSVCAALQRGVSEALQKTGEDYKSRLQNVSQLRSKQLGQAQQLEVRIKSIADQSVILNSPDLERLLVAASSVSAPG